MIRAFLIDPFAQTVSEVQWDGTFRHLRTFLQGDDLLGSPYPVDTLDSARVASGDGNHFARCWVDDTGYEVEDQRQAWFRLEGYGAPLAGRGFVHGEDHFGDFAGMIEAPKVEWIPHGHRPETPPTIIYTSGECSNG